MLRAKADSVPVASNGAAMESFSKRERERRKRAKSQEKTDRKAQRDADRARDPNAAEHNSDISGAPSAEPGSSTDDARQRR